MPYQLSNARIEILFDRSLFDNDDADDGRFCKLVETCLVSIRGRKDPRYVRYCTFCEQVGGIARSRRRCRALRLETKTGMWLQSGQKRNARTMNGRFQHASRIVLLQLLTLLHLHLHHSIIAINKMLVATACLSCVASGLAAYDLACLVAEDPSSHVLRVDSPHRVGSLGVR